MNPIRTIRHFFQKRQQALSLAAIAAEQQSRYNALFHADPDKVVAAVTSFKAGTLAPLARIIEDFEDRDDKMKTCSMKMRAAAARCDYQVMIREGFESDPRAQRHAGILKRFWSGISCTSAFKSNERGSFRLLKKQMMDGQSYGFAVHEIVWIPRADGEISAEFIQVPLWHFENRTGRLRFLERTTDYAGSEMKPGEWLVTTGDAVGIAAAICACAKHMSFQDWLLFSERCGIPMVHAKTGAAFKSEAWNNLSAAVRNIGRDFRILTDNDTTISPVSFANSGTLPYPPLVEWADRAIAALYRGADLSTISRDDGTGASLQGDESAMLEQDFCAMLGETLHEQVDKFVIRYCCGEEPLAYISIEPVVKPDVKTDIDIDNHLISHGCKLSKKDMLQRYGRIEANPDDPDDSPAEPAPQSAPAGFPNERPGRESPQSPGRSPLAQIAASILDGSVTLEEGLKRAQTELDAATLESLSGNLQEALEDAMYLAALESLDRSGSTSLPNECIWLVNEFDEAEHPRDNDGKFSTSGSSDRGGEAPSSQQKLSRQEECKALLAKYKASTDHPSVDDVVSGQVPIRQALEKGFEATFGGQKVVFFTGFLSKKYEDALDPGRLSLIRHALERRSRMFPVKHHGNQIGLVEQLTRSNSDNRFVITADRDTSLAVNVMKCNNAYIKREYK